MVLKILKSVSAIPVYSKWISDGKDIQAKATKVCIETRDSNFISPSFVGSSKARDQVGDALDAILSGTETIDEALKTMREVFTENKAVESEVK